MLSNIYFYILFDIFFGILSGISSDISIYIFFIMEINIFSDILFGIFLIHF